MARLTIGQKAERVLKSLRGGGYLPGQRHLRLLHILGEKYDGPHLACASLSHGVNCNAFAAR